MLWRYLDLVHRGVEEAKAIDLDTGIARLQSVVDENGNADSIPFAFLQLGILFQEKGDWRRAVVQFSRATERRPNYVEAHLNLAYALAHEGRRPEAIAEYSKVAKLSPDDLERGNHRVLANQWL
jgi:tetratricopeptide (TPR) repeat protein